LAFFIGNRKVALPLFSAFPKDIGHCKTLKKSEEVQMETTTTSRIIRKPELLNMLGISDPTVYRWERAGKFPKRLRLGGNSCGWLEEEVNNWIEERAAAR
jgi:prophage regulatory protein